MYRLYRKMAINVHFLFIYIDYSIHFCLAIISCLTNTVSALDPSFRVSVKSFIKMFWCT